MNPHFSKNLRLLRELKGWTRKELADEIQGLSEDMVYTYESGIAMPKKEIIYSRLDEIFGFDKLELQEMIIDVAEARQRLIQKLQEVNEKQHEYPAHIIQSLPIEQYKEYEKEIAELKNELELYKQRERIYLEKINQLQNKK